MYHGRREIRSVNFKLLHVFTFARPCICIAKILFSTVFKQSLCYINGRVIGTVDNPDIIIKHLQ